MGDWGGSIGQLVAWVVCKRWSLLRDADHDFFKWYCIRRFWDRFLFGLVCFMIALCGEGTWRGSVGETSTKGEK